MLLMTFRSSAMRPRTLLFALLFEAILVAAIVAVFYGGTVAYAVLGALVVMMVWLVWRVETSAIQDEVGRLASEVVQLGTNVALLTGNVSVLERRADVQS